MNYSRSALFHTKTRVWLKYSVSDCGTRLSINISCFRYSATSVGSLYLNIYITWNRLHRAPSIRLISEYSGEQNGVYEEDEEDERLRFLRFFLAIKEDEEVLL